MQGDNEVEPGPVHLPFSVHPVQLRAPLLNSDKGPAVSAEAPRKKPHGAVMSVKHVAPDLTLCSMPSGSVQWGTAARTSFARSVLALRCAPHGAQRVGRRAQREPHASSHGCTQARARDSVRRSARRRPVSWHARSAA